ncbi:MAG: hypothetical protein IJV30_11860 [Oscillospiraceae bacterium]|nr:hypothetical protein [Oscillospiraceae bacterium]
MKSSRLSFNTSIARNTLRRCWPLWAAYLGFLLVTFPLPLLSEIRTARGRSGVSLLYVCREQIAQMAVFQALAGMAVAVLTVMLLFGYLYNSRGNTLMNSLPIRRESLFLTLYLTGLIPMLLCELLVMGLTMLLTAAYDIGTVWFLRWFACAALGLLAFYGFALFCAMLTGNILVLPAVYVVLNLTVIGFETCIRELLSNLVYGMTPGALRLSFLSPPVKISDDLKVVTSYPETVRMEGLGTLAVYAAVGVMFALLALLLYRKRRMESVSDFVAIPVLKPVFRVCMGFGGAFLFAAVIFENFFKNSVSGSAAAWVMAVLLVIGACLGWLIAEMMIRRTVRAFPLRRKGLALICLICVMTVIAAETDVTGFEKRVPDPDKVDHVEFCYDSEFSDPENIRLVTELHRELVRDKQIYDSKSEDYMRLGEKAYRLTAQGEQEADLWMDYWVPISYVMQNGRELQRVYTIVFNAHDVDRPDSTMGKILNLLNSREGIRSRMQTTVPMEERYINYAVINREGLNGMENSYRLSPQETVELWNLAMLPDAEEGNLSLYTIVDTEENMKTQTNLRIDINLFDETRTHDPYYWNHSYRVFTFSERCLDWIEEHTKLDWETLDVVTAERENNKAA